MPGVAFVAAWAVTCGGPEDEVVMHKVVLLPDEVVMAIRDAVGNERHVVIAARSSGAPEFAIRPVTRRAGKREPETMVIAPAHHPGWHRLRQLVQRKIPTTEVPSRGQWLGHDDEVLWRIVVGQIAVMGGSRGWEKLSPEWSGQQLGYANLKTKNDDEARRSVDACFRRFGVRFVGEKPSAKADHVIRNLRMLEERGGPREYFRQVAAEPDDARRIQAVMRSMSCVGKKGARDLLMGLGMIRNVIAIDSRVLTTLESAGVITGRNGARGKRYAELERAVVENVAVVLGVEPVVVDRAIYQSGGSPRSDGPKP